VPPTLLHPAPLTDHLTVWVNGRLYGGSKDLSITALDAGLTVGNGAFEALKVTEHGPFALRRHLARLDRSAAALGLPDPDHNVIRRAVEEVLAGRTFTDGKVRITYTAGRGPLGSQTAFGPPTLVVAADARQLSAPSASIVTAPWTRNEHGALAGVKSTSYAENVRSLRYATERAASEAILVNTAGHVCEGTGSNLFCVFGSEIVTPPLSSGPLAGVTRDLLREWCEITEADLTLAEAQAADEVFLTSSLRDVQGVHEWDGLAFPRLGPVTTTVAARFAELSSGNLEP
jgi:branched-chain amino acid aminotransferase